MREGKELVFGGHILCALCLHTVSYLIPTATSSGKCYYLQIKCYYSYKWKPNFLKIKVFSNWHDQSVVKGDFHSKSAQHQNPHILTPSQFSWYLVVGNHYLLHLTLSIVFFFFFTSREARAKHSTPFTGIIKFH